MNRGQENETPRSGERPRGENGNERRQDIHSPPNYPNGGRKVNGNAGFATILDFLPAGRLRRVLTGSNGPEYAGPCPGCGGEDRFRVWPEHLSGATGGRYYCRGCNATGDGIEFLERFRGMSFKEAKAALGIDGATGSFAARQEKARQGDGKPVAITPVPEGVPDPTFHHHRLCKPTATYTYRDAEGRRLGYVCRFDKPETGAGGKPQKEFCPKVWTAQGWRWQALPAPRPLYGLDRMRLAAPNAPVLGLEGEGKADAAYSVLGPEIVALSLNGGSSSANNQDYSPMRGRRVAYWPDADAPGLKAAQTFKKKALEAGAVSVVIVRPPEGVPQGWDIADAIKEGWDRAKLIAYIENNSTDDGTDVSCMSDSEHEGHDESSILPPPPPVPLEAFPPQVTALLQEAAESFKAPLQIPVACLLGMLSCLVEGARLISLRPSWKEPGNIWLAVVALSGIGKSPCAKAFFKAIGDLEHESFKKWQNERISYKCALYEHQRDRRKAGASTSLIPPEAPARRQGYVDDATIESVGAALQDNPKGIMWEKDELSGLIADMDKYSKSSGGTRARLLSSYDGAEWKTNRTSDPARNLHIRNAYVSIFGGIQPAMLPKVFETGANGADEASGFLQRFIMIRAEREQPSYWTETSLSPESIELLESITQVLWPWDIESDDKGRPIEKVVPVTTQAKSIFIDWFNGIAQEEFLSANASLLSKLKGKAMRLCLLLHCLDAALAKTDGMEPVTENTMRRALLLTDWVKAHQTQCWRFFTPGKAKQVNPIERAIMQVVVDEAARIEADGWRISNERLFTLVEKKLGMPGLSDVKLGKAASGLGLPPCSFGKGRGRAVTSEKINEFKATVGTVGTVGNPYAARDCGEDNTVGQLSATVGGVLPSRALPTVADSAPTVGHNPQSIGIPCFPTVPTVPTDGSDNNLQPGLSPELDPEHFDDPDFRDRVEI